MHYFSSLQMRPYYFNKTNANWETTKVLEDVPKQMLADISANPDEELANYMQGLGDEENMSFSDIPWYVWNSSFVFMFSIFFIVV